MVQSRHRVRSLGRVLAGVTMTGVTMTGIAGCSMFGSNSGAPSPSAGSSSAVPSAVPLTPPPVTLNAPKPATAAGYQLVAAPAAVQASFGKVAHQYQGVFAGVTVRSVRKGSAGNGTLVLLGLHPELIGNTAVEGKLVNGMVAGMTGRGVKATKAVVAGQQVAVASTKTSNIVAWYRHGTVVLVLGGSDAAASMAFSKAYISVS